MAEKQARHAQRAGRIKDARGRKVTQLDLIAMYLLRQHNVIEADVLQAIAHEKGVRITGKERASLVVGVVGALLVISLFTHAVLTGDIRGAPLAKSSSLIFLCAIPFSAWYRIKRSRFGKVAAAMLKYLRCPHCGYDLRLLPIDPADGATICPECGCAWRLDNFQAAGGITRFKKPGQSRESGLPKRPSTAIFIATLLSIWTWFCGSPNRQKGAYLIDKTAISLHDG